MFYDSPYMLLWMFVFRRSKFEEIRPESSLADDHWQPVKVAPEPIGKSVDDEVNDVMLRVGKIFSMTSSQEDLTSSSHRAVSNLYIHYGPVEDINDKVFSSNTHSAAISGDGDALSEPHSTSVYCPMTGSGDALNEINKAAYLAMSTPSEDRYANTTPDDVYMNDDIDDDSGMMGYDIPKMMHIYSEIPGEQQAEYNNISSEIPGEQQAEYNNIYEDLDNFRA